MVNRHLHLQKWKRLCTEVYPFPASVHDARHSDDHATAGLNKLHDFLYASTGCDDILADEYALSLLHLEAPSERHGFVLAFRENAANAELACDFLPDHYAADRRRHDKIHSPIVEVSEYFAAKELVVLRILKDLSALEIFRAVKPTCEAEVSMLKSTCRFEEVEYLFFFHFGL